MLLTFRQLQVVRAVSQWRYKPVMLNGKAVDQRAAVRIRFSDE